MKNQENSEVIIVPKRCVVHENSETKAKYTNFPIVFPDGLPGQIILLKGTRYKWNPHDEVLKITVDYVES